MKIQINQDVSSCRECVAGDVRGAHSEIVLCKFKGTFNKCTKKVNNNEEISSVSPVSKEHLSKTTKGK